MGEGRGERERISWAAGQLGKRIRATGHRSLVGSYRRGPGRPLGRGLGLGPDQAASQIVSKIKTECPHVPLVLYINGNGGLLERMKDTGVDVIGLDWTVDMADGRRRLGNGISVQGNVDPAYLFSPLPVLTDEIHRVVKSAGPKGHILNLGHGVLVKTPEEAVAHFFDVTRSLRYDTLFQGYVTEELQPVA